MRQQLKKSAKSSNFWTAMATMATVVTGAIYAVLSQDPEAFKTMTLSQLASLFFFQAANVFQHLNKEK